MKTLSTKRKPFLGGRLPYMETSAKKPVAAILVDYDFYRDSPAVREFVTHREGRASLVALVSTPAANHPDMHDDTVEWNVVLSNHKGHKDQQFKSDSLDVLSKYSNLYPCIAIDYFNEGIYDDAGTLIYLGPGNF